MNIVIITGASSGIGREFAVKMDQGFHCIDEFWLVARSRDKLEELAGTLKHNARIFALDITDRRKLTDLEDAVFRHKAIVRMLINCAGYGIMGTFCEHDRELELGMIRLNCEALTEVTHRMIPYMREGSRILQMASAAAFLPQPDFAVYAATKSYVLSFARALGEELKAAGIYVTAVCPGPVDTPFFDIAERDTSALALKKYTMVSVDKVVVKALKDSLRGHSMSVYGLSMKSCHLLSRILPHSVILEAMNRMKKMG